MTTHQPLPQNPGLNPNNARTIKSMTIVQACLLVFTLMGSLISSVPAKAQSVIPTGYNATPGDGVAQGGSYNYDDRTGHQLTDGIYGANDWSANLGNGNAHEWVGWQAADPVIAFQFSAPVTINQVGIDFNLTQSASILLPTTVTIGGTEFSVDPNAVPNDTRGTIYFNGNWTGSSLLVELMDCNTSHWMFVDEVSFSTLAVPEPSVFGLLAGGFGLMIACLKGRQSIRQF